jgi:glutamyl-tRNA reductase
VARTWAALRPEGSLLLETCHRVEIYGSAHALDELWASAPTGVRRVRGSDVARHLVRVAVGRDSSVIAEDQILHQLRRAAHAARDGQDMPREMDRLLDLALRAGRRARSWLPARRPSLVDVAIGRAIGTDDVTGKAVLVVGTGEMGRSAIVNLVARGASVHVASRTFESARVAATHLGVRPVPFEPGADLAAQVCGVVVALKGRWTLSSEAIAALVDARLWIVDISSPPALDPELAHALAARVMTIDDLAEPDTDGAQPVRLLARLDRLIDDTVEEFERWAASETRRQAAEALTSRARAVRSAELERLWRRVPTLDESQRAEVERALDHVTQDLLREPLEQLGRDADDRHVRAARELFRL